MNSKIIPFECLDWTQLNQYDSFWNTMDPEKPDLNFGIHEYNGQLWTGGFVGVGRIFDKNSNPVRTGGRDHVAVISSRFGMDPWKMLEKVMADEEYEDYLEELIKSGKYLYRIFYDQPLIKLEQGQRNDDQILFALSFINGCFALCKKGLKKKMVYQEENFNAKIRGKIDVKKNIRLNTSHGRNERFSCKFIDFTLDNLENRIIKAALIRCKSIVEQTFEVHGEAVRRLMDCMNRLGGVKQVSIKSKDFNKVTVTGLYTYYKPLLSQAKCILGQKYHSYRAENGRLITKSVYTIPYMINMETVFEFYARGVLKKVLREGLKDFGYQLDPYSNKIFLEKGITKAESSKKGIHLMPYCIPDLVVREIATGRIVAVLDAKYKPHGRAVRSDSLQLLSYVLLTGADRCGFIFPDQKTALKSIGEDGYMVLETPLIPGLKYYELLLGDVVEERAAEQMFL